VSVTVSYLAHLAVQHPGGALNTELLGCLRCDLVFREGREECGCRWGEPHFPIPIADAISARLALLASGKRLQDD
jgi:hypothetical protein